MFRLSSATAVALSVALAVPAAAQSLSNVQFQNGIAISGALQDQSDPTVYTRGIDRRVGFFSDIYHDRTGNEW